MGPQRTTFFLFVCMARKMWVGLWVARSFYVAWQHDFFLNILHEFGMWWVCLMRWWDSCRLRAAFERTNAARPCRLDAGFIHRLYASYMPLGFPAKTTQKSVKTWHFQWSLMLRHAGISCTAFAAAGESVAVAGWCIHLRSFKFMHEFYYLHCSSLY